MPRTGTVYLLHFDAPYKHARHYIGFAEDLDARLILHQRGEGARLLAAIIGAGISFTLARTWTGDRTLERRIKNLGGAARVCPICSPHRHWGEFHDDASRLAVDTLVPDRRIVGRDDRLRRSFLAPHEGAACLSKR